MKKILLIMAAIALLPQISQGGISFGGIPGTLTFDFLVSAKKHQVMPEEVAAGGADPGRAKMTSPVRQGQRPGLQPLLTSCGFSTQPEN
jgi:hypothetical protein